MIHELNSTRRVTIRIKDPFWTETILSHSIFNRSGNATIQGRISKKTIHGRIMARIILYRYADDKI